MHPKPYSFTLQSMSLEKIQFKLPAIFIIGPKNDMEALTKYVRTVEALESDKTIDSIILGILEGETRLHSSTMSIEEIFNNRQAFKDKLLKNIQQELDEIGLLAFSPNLKDLDDDPHSDSKYFYNMRQKTLSYAENQARIDIAENKKKGEIGEKERTSLIRQQVAQYESETVQKENERFQEIEKSKAALEVVRAEAYRLQEIAKIESANATHKRAAELEQEVEQKRIATQTERTRVSEMSKAQVQAEVIMKETEGQANALRMKSDAELYAAQQHAKGIYALYEAQANGVNKLIESFGSNSETLLKYLMMEKGILEKLLATSADAIRGLNPKITIWNTSSDSKNNTNYTDVIRDIFKTIPISTQIIQDQTGIKIADNIIKVPSEESRN